ncbi:MAG: histidinol-phosphate transaminase [Sandaracinaceae bacterium]
MSDGPSSRLGERYASLRAYHTAKDPLPIKLDANESSLALPDAVTHAIARSVRTWDLQRYPDLAARTLRGAIAARIGAHPDELVLGVGSDESIGIAMRALDRPSAKGPPAVLFGTPTFVMYDITARVQGFAPVAVPLDDEFDLDVDAMLRAIDEHDPSLVFLATPNNPTGNAFSDGRIERVIEAAPNALVVIDEAYAPFAGRTTPFFGRHPNVATLGTLSKIGLAGLRVGWLRAPATLAHEIDKARPPYNLPTPSQSIAVELLTRHADVLDAGIRETIAERDRVVAALTALGSVRVRPSDANFILIEVPDAARAHRHLADDGIQVRRFDDPRLSSALRVTIGTRDENGALIASLRAYVGAE